jgi:redox-sensitive bicupin YhaK (pirin superfamily)
MDLAIDRIYAAGAVEMFGPTHRHRYVVPAGDFAAHSPFLMMAEDWFAPPAGFPTHPHRGMETVTVVLDGRIVHRDHTGAHGVLDAGDVQFMTAGAGVLHSEMPGPQGVHTLQLWLNLPAAQKRTKARYVDQRLARTPVYRGAGVEVRVYAGELGDIAQPSGTTWPIALLDVSLAQGAAFDLPVAAGARAFAYVLRGTGRIGATRTAVGEETVAWAGPAQAPGRLRFAADTALRAIVFAGQPIDEPVVAHGPFVMNTEAEIVEAFNDYRAGRFV